MARINMTVGKKSGIGFFITLLLMLIVGAAGYWGLNRVSRALDLYQGTSLFLIEFKSIQKDFIKYTFHSYAEGRKEQIEAFAQLRESLKIINNNMERLKGYLSAMNADEKALDVVKTALNNYESAVSLFADAENKKIEIETECANVYARMNELIQQGSFRNESMVSHGRQAEAVRTGYISRNVEARWDQLITDINAFGGAIDNWGELVKASDALKPLAGQIKSEFLKYRDLMNQYHPLVMRQTDLSVKMNQDLSTLNTSIQNLSDDTEKMTRRAKQLSLSIIIWVMGVAALIGVGYSVLSVRSLTGILRRTIEGITNSSDEVSNASGQISSISDTLAESAQNQVVIIDEVANALKDAMATTEKNAGFAGEAHRLIGSTDKIINNANRIMHQLTASMDQISTAGNKTSKIIKDIDAIAFQTNLLALNAAVEAARAGEAGAGFAVVAGEVRNLAMRSAEAAKNTAHLIDETIGKVKAGNDMVVETNKSYEEISNSVSRLEKMLAEIGSLSNNQVDQIKRINSAIGNVNDLAHQNATTAEESASAAKELNGQAANLNHLVANMEVLITTSSKITTSANETDIERLELAMPHRRLDIGF